jgi:Sulfotransferase family
MRDETDLLDEAKALTGLSDFGNDSFREGLQLLVGSLRREAKLNSFGEAVQTYLIINLLSQRLQVEDWYRRHPDIDDEPIRRPLIGLGLPRTGSTALSFLLSLDADARSLRRWEASEPCPPPSTVSGTDPRIARAEAGIAAFKEMVPRISDLVPVTATGPYECQDLMALDFKSQYFQAFAHIPSYSAWLLDADLTSTYHYERRVLKLLQWGAPTRPWRLKSPSHMLWLNYLDRAFPDARFVMTHRDPAEVIVSVADLYAELASQYTDSLDRRYLGALNVEHWTVATQRAVDFRDSGNNDRFFDMDFRAVQRDPIAEVRRLYAWLGEPMSANFEDHMREWWLENGASRETNVHPDPSTFGLEIASLRTLFADYTARTATWTTTAIRS